MWASLCRIALVLISPCGTVIINNMSTTSMRRSRHRTWLLNRRGTGGGYARVRTSPCVLGGDGGAEENGAGEVNVPASDEKAKAGFPIPHSMRGFTLAPHSPQRAFVLNFGLWAEPIVRLLKQMCFFFFFFSVFFLSSDLNFFFRFEILLRF
jgi:hypothetical protein